MCAQSLNCVQLFATQWTVACQSPLSMGFSRQGYWSGLPFFSSGGSSQPRDRARVSCIGQADSLPLSYQESPVLKYMSKIMIRGKSKLYVKHLCEALRMTSTISCKSLLPPPKKQSCELGIIL